MCGGGFVHGMSDTWHDLQSSVDMGSDLVHGRWGQLGDDFVNTLSTPVDLTVGLYDGGEDAVDWVHNLFWDPNWVPAWQKGPSGPGPSGKGPSGKGPPGPGPGPSGPPGPTGSTPEWDIDPKTGALIHNGKPVDGTEFTAYSGESAQVSQDEANRITAWHKMLTDTSNDYVQINNEVMAARAAADKLAEDLGKEIDVRHKAITATPVSYQTVQANADPLAQKLTDLQNLIASEVQFDTITAAKLAQCTPPQGPAGPGPGPAGPGPGQGPAGPGPGDQGPAGPGPGDQGPAGPGQGPAGPGQGPAGPGQGPAGQWEWAWVPNGQVGVSGQQQGPNGGIGVNYPNGTGNGTGNGLGSGSSSDSLSSLMSMLPEMAMMAPMAMMPLAMMGGMGNRGQFGPQPGQVGPTGTEVADHTTPDGGAQSQVVSAAKDGDGDAPGAEAAAKPVDAVQPVGNSDEKANTDVQLKNDHSTIHAPNSQAATAIQEAANNGADPKVAYAKAGITLPPAGTPVTNPITPEDLLPGDVGEFKDHWVMALGDGQVLVNGQKQPASNVIQSSPDFLGWIRPTQQSSGQPADTSTALTSATTPPPPGDAQSGTPS